jgi:hypothetical protein
MKAKYTPPKCVSLGQICRDREFILIDGIKIGKYVERDGKAYLQILDKDPNRSRERGTKLVEILIKDLGKIAFCGDEDIM